MAMVLLNYHMIIAIGVHTGRADYALALPELFYTWVGTAGTGLVLFDFTKLWLKVGIALYFLNVCVYPRAYIEIRY